MASTVTVNGQSVAQYLSKQKSLEIQEFLRNEMFSFRYATRKPTTTTVRNVSKVHAAGNGRIECK